MANFDKELDARGLNCPLPILRTKKFCRKWALDRPSESSRPIRVR